MEYTTTYKLELSERFDYVTIDLDKQFFYIEVVNLQSNITVLKISINLQKDEMVNAVVQKYYTEYE